MSRLARVFGEPERTQLLEALERCRCVSADVTRHLDKSELYKRNAALRTAIDDRVEAIHDLVEALAINRGGGTNA